MRSRSLIVVVAACSLAHAQGALKGRGADPPISKWSGETLPQDIAIIKGERYLVARCPRPTAAAPLVAVDPRSRRDIGAGPFRRQQYPSCSPESEEAQSD